MKEKLMNRLVDVMVLVGASKGCDFEIGPAKHCGPSYEIVPVAISIPGLSIYPVFQILDIEIKNQGSVENLRSLLEQRTEEALLKAIRDKHAEPKKGPIEIALDKNKLWNDGWNHGYNAGYKNGMEEMRAKDVEILNDTRFGDMLK